MSFVVLLCSACLQAVQVCTWARWLNVCCTCAGNELWCWNRIWDSPWHHNHFCSSAFSSLRITDGSIIVPIFDRVADGWKTNLQAVQTVEWHGRHHCLPTLALVCRLFMNEMASVVWILHALSQKKKVEPAIAIVRCERHSPPRILLLRRGCLLPQDHVQSCQPEQWKLLMSSTSSITISHPAVHSPL